MTINGNYSSPVSVNGYQCWNCTDVDNAKKHIDPQHPKSGPYGIDAATDPTRPNQSKAVTFGGALSEPAQTSSGGDKTDLPGAQLDISV
jgi:hypothetical protein